MDLGIAGRRAAVAGASGGLGLATAKALAAAGVHVAICGRDEARLDGGGRRGRPRMRADRVRRVDCRRRRRSSSRAATEALGGVDILVANAGGPPPGDFASTDRSTCTTPALDLSLMSVVGMCKAAVPAMQAQHWGRVVAITSIAVRQPIGHADPVEHGAGRRHRLPEDGRPRGRPRRRHREHACSPASTPPIG